MDSFINLGSFIIQFVNIAIIIFILNKFLFKPYMKYLIQEEKIRKELEESHIRLDEIRTDAINEAKDIVDKAKKDANFIKNESIEIAKSEANTIVVNAKSEAEKIRIKGEADIENERKALMAELKDKVLSVALKINEKIFTKPEANKDFVAKILQEEKI